MSDEDEALSLAMVALFDEDAPDSDEEWVRQIDLSRRLLEKAIEHIRELEAENKWFDPHRVPPPDAEQVLWLEKSASGFSYRLHTYDETPGRRSWPSFGIAWRRLPPPSAIAWHNAQVVEPHHTQEEG